MIRRENAYNEALTAIKNLGDRFKSARSHPFVSKSTTEEMEQLFSKLTKELEEKREAYSRQFSASSDSLLQAFGDIFEDRVGEPYSSEELQAVFTKGSERYAKKIPPGFEDAGKIGKGKEDSEVAESDRKRKYGDLILWLQILDYAASEKKSIIFVTDDGESNKKEDWWQKHGDKKDKKVGVRVELKREFWEKTAKKMLIYNSEQFFEFATKHFRQITSNEIVNEIKEISQYQPAFEVDQGIRNALQVAEIERHGVINAISEALRVNPALEIDQKIQDDLRIAEHANIRDEMNAISKYLRDSIDFNSFFDIRTGVEKVSEDLQRQRQALLESASLASIDSVMFDPIRRSIEEAAGLRNKKMGMIDDEDTSEDE
ncbi:MAG: PIN domain-containing protein [Trueperaceae bacterium]|nr:PIN domain-containing protein [Trueperaceae bacterium]